MSELGHFLKKKRKEKGISLEAVQEATKIRKRYLEAIENGEYHILPGQFYARAFIKSYAEAVGLDVEDILQTYSHELPQIQSASPETVIRRRKKEVKTTSPKLGKWVARLLAYSFLLVVGFFIYLAYVNYMGEQDSQVLDPNVGSGLESEVEVDEEPEGEVDSEVEEPVEDEHPVVETPAPPEPTLTYLQSSGRNHWYEFANAEQVEVTLQASSGRIWFQLTNTANSSTIDTGELAVGTERTWNLSAYEEVRFRFGNIIAFTLTVNGEPIDLSGFPEPRNPHNFYIQFKPLEVNQE